MKQYYAAVGLALLLTTIHVDAAQDDHAPSVEVCRADMNLWRDQMTEYFTAEADYNNKGLPNRSSVMGLTFLQLNHRSTEKGQCAVVDPPSGDEYNDLLVTYGEARDDRFKFFVKRHNLLKQMLAEDTAGKRH
jgi:hypothetical protein